MTRDEFKKLCQSKVVILDGATGTELGKLGLAAGVCPEKWVLDNPEAIVKVHDCYRASGSDIVYAPTFGGNRIKLAEFGLEDQHDLINQKLAEIAKNASPNKLVFGDIAPSGRFVEMAGDWGFEDAVNVFRSQAVALIAGGVDGLAIETMMDLQEARAALIGARDAGPDLPIMVTMTFEESGKTLTGCDPVACLIALQALGVDAFGCNCSTGPESMAKIIRSLKDFASVPLIAKPNAGLPKLVDGRTIFSMSGARFGELAPDLVSSGCSIIGGCCGTTPEHIRAMAKAVSKISPPLIAPKIHGVVSSSRSSFVISPTKPLAIIGERINPTGKKALQSELRAGKMDMVMNYAIEQTEQGAALLDVNMGLSGIDEVAMMQEAIKTVGMVSNLPLCIDSTNPDAIESALRLYPGRALLNSISLEKIRLQKVLPIAAKYGAMLILLPLTDDGLPENTAERVENTHKLLAEVAKYGYDNSDCCIDALIMAVAADAKAAVEALSFIGYCHDQLHCATVCGLSNVSFGLPARPVVNQAFMLLAAERGLNLAIANPTPQPEQDYTVAQDALLNKDLNFERFLAKYADYKPMTANAQLPIAELLRRGVLLGDVEGISTTVAKGMESLTPEQIINQIMIPAINEVGVKFERKEYFLPQLIRSAEAMKRGTEFLEPYLAATRSGSETKIKMVLATVKGDIHDIGKNIVKIMLSNYGFEVIDLGKDVPADIIINAAMKHEAQLIGLSALMTTTMAEMRTVVDLARQKGLELSFIVGGAVVDAEFASSIGAHYAADAISTVRIAQEIQKS